MCKSRNGTIFKACYQEALRQTGKAHLSNAELRRFIGKHTCLVDKDKK